MLYVPSKKILTPELLVPGSRPAAPVRINRKLAEEYNLVAAYYFMERSGKRVWDLVGENHGTITDTTEIEWNPSSGLTNVSDASTARVNLGSITSDNPLSGYPSQQMSICARVSINASLNNVYPRIFDKSDSGSGRDGWVFSVRNNDTIEGYVDNSWFASDSTSPSFLGNTTTLGVSIRSGSQRFYQDGNPRGSTTNTVTFPADTENAAITNWNHSTDRSMNGTIHYLLIADTMWSEDQHVRINADPYMFLEPDYPEFLIIGAPSGAAGGTATYSLDSILQKQGITAAVSLDAALQQAKSAAADLDSIIQKASLSTTDIDAALQATGLSTADIDAILQTAGASTASLDAALKAAKSITTSLDAHLIGGATGAVTALLDAVIKTSAAITASIDAAIQQGHTGTASLDAVIATIESSAIQLDAIVSKAGLTSTASMDAAILGAKTLTMSMDAIIEAGLTFGIDAIVQTTSLTVSAAIDAVITGGCIALLDPETAATVISLSDPESAASAISISDPEDNSGTLCS